MAWGDNQTDLINGSGPDNLRFIFTSSEFIATPGTDAAKSNNGQEIARFTPACANCPVNTGSLGIGDFSPGSPIGPGTSGYVGATLDVVGDARIRTVTNNNNLNQVLVRNPNDQGRIHWRDMSSFGALGNDCGSTPNALVNNWEIPMDIFNFNFIGQHVDGARVGIGINSCYPAAKLDVLQEQGENTIVINAINTAPIAGSYSNAEGGIAVQGRITTGDGNTCESMAIGGLFTSNSSSFNFGVVGIAIGDNNQGCYTNNYGGYFVADNGDAGNVAIYAEADLSLGNDALLINGNSTITGALWSTSDERLKTNVHTIENATATINKIRPVSYQFKQDAANLQLPKENQYGVIAQELEVVLPELVRKLDVPRDINFDGTNGQQGNTGGLEEVSVVNYNALLPILIAAFKEQSERIDRLEQQLSSCCNASRSGTNTDKEPTGTVIPTRLESKDEPTLGQNIPNPFENATRIPIYIPLRSMKAEIAFYGNDGKIVQILAVKDRGNATIEVDASTLAAGIYSYTLFVDGKPVDTKRMVKQ